LKDVKERRIFLSNNNNNNNNNSFITCDLQSSSWVDLQNNKHSGDYIRCTKAMKVLAKGEATAEAIEGPNPRNISFASSGVMVSVV